MIIEYFKNPTELTEEEFKEDFGNEFSEEREILTDLFDSNIGWYRC